MSSNEAKKRRSRSSPGIVPILWEMRVMKDLWAFRDQKESRIVPLQVSRRSEGGAGVGCHEETGELRTRPQESCIPLGRRALVGP